MQRQLDNDNLIMIHPTKFMFAGVNGAIELKYQVVNDRDEPVRGQWLLALETSDKVHMTTVSYMCITMSKYLVLSIPIQCDNFIPCESNKFQV